MNYWLVEIMDHGINGATLMHGTEERLVQYISAMTGGFMRQYHEISESNANMLTRFLTVIDIPAV